MVDLTVRYNACPSDTSGAAQAERIRKLLENSGESVYDEMVPPVYADYRSYAVNTVFQRAFSQRYMPTGWGWIDHLLEREGFNNTFQSNMQRMLDTGEYFAALSVRGGMIRIDRLPRDWVRRLGVYEKTGEILLLVYIEPIVLPNTSNTRIGWRKSEMTPERTVVSISTDEHHPDDKDQYTQISVTSNPYGFIPVVPFKLGTNERGEPIWWKVRYQIDQINDIVNDIRMINSYNAAPVKWVKTDGAFHGIGNYGYVEMGLDDAIGALVVESGQSLETELVNTIGMYSDILGAPVTSILQVGKNASGEAIEKRMDTLTRTAKQLREHVGNQMELMFRMMSAFVAQGLIEGVDFNDSLLKPLLTECVICENYSERQCEEADLAYFSHIGEPVDLAVYDVPQIKWPSIEPLDPQGLDWMAQAFEKLLTLGIISKQEAKIVLGFNYDQFTVASDMAALDTDSFAKTGTESPETESIEEDVEDDADA